MGDTSQNCDDSVNYGYFIRFAMVAAQSREEGLLYVDATHR